MKWRITTSQLVGQSHLPNDIPCQDKTFSKVENGVTVMALSDGCGSSRLSHIGADITVKTICDVLTTSFNDLLKMDVVQSRQFILNHVINALEHYVEEHEEVGIKDLNATFLFVAVNEDDIAIMGHIGDGYIGANQNNVLMIKSLEKKTGEVNGTVYPTSKHAEYFLQLKRGSAKDMDAFVMMSDGGGDGLVDSRVPFVKQFAPHVAGVIEYMGSHEMDENQTFVDDLIERVRDHIFSGDDCSLAVMVKENAKVDSIEPYELEKPVDTEDTEEVKTIEEKAKEIKVFETIYYYLKETLNDVSNLKKEIVEHIVTRLQAGAEVNDIKDEVDTDKSFVETIDHILYELNEED